MDDDGVVKELNAAKEQCLEATINRDYLVTEHEFVRHICRVLESKLANDCDLHIDLGERGLIRPMLREFFWIRTVDAIKWILMCVAGNVVFEHKKEDVIPILCRFYNDNIGEVGWSDDDHTMMKVLNKYIMIKAGGYGNFARFLE